MRISLDKQDNYTILKVLEEKLDTRNAPELKSEFLMLNAEGVRNIILDLENTRYVDSSGLSSILVANRLCGQLNGYLILCCVSSHVEKMIKISQLDKILNILPTVQEAIEAIFLSALEEEVTGELNGEGDGEES